MEDYQIIILGVSFILLGIGVVLYGEKKIKSNN